VSAMRKIILALAFACLGAAGPSPHQLLSAAQARAEQDWRKEFDDICAKTQDAMALSVEELKSLVTRCDDLKPQLDRLDESSRKVFTRRLQACRDLYQFVLESRDKTS
jgi:hypothetical protein